MTDAAERTRRAWIFPAVSAAIALAATVALAVIAVGHAPFSVIDEHVHFDTLVKLEHGEYPHRGSLYSTQTVEEWACGVGHEAAALPCESAEDVLDDLPSGKFTTGYIHYPTYYLGAIGLAGLLAPFGVSLLDAGRLFSALVLGLGVLTCGAAGWFLGLRRFGLIAATALPAAASMTLLTGTIINPSATAILCGALISWAGIRWMQTGHGFGWVLGATGFAASIAVTNTLPAGVIALAAIAMLASRRLREAITPLRARWYHPVSLAAVAIVPIVIWNRVIASTATIENSALYGAFAPTSRLNVVEGLAREFVSLHTPWVEAEHLLAGPGNLMSIPRGIATGLPTWITVIAFGALVLALLLPRVTGRASTPVMGALHLGGSDRVLLRLLVGCSLAVILLYPPLLRLNQLITFGIDFGIVNRYSVSLAPLLVLLVLLLFRGRAFSIALAAIGAYGMLVIPFSAL